VHLAVIGAPYAAAILLGTKTIESRFTRTRRVPFGRVSAGERISFIARKAGLIVTATAERVESFAGLTPLQVEAIRSAYGAAIGATDAYWRAKRDCRFGTLVWIGGAELARHAPDDVHGRERSYRSAWVVRPREQCVYPACCAHGPAAHATDVF
jgi:hypothetical protein